MIEDENAFPFTYCMQLFEETTAVWCEEVREKRRGLCAKLGTENPRLEDLKLLPGANGLPNFQFPRVWDLALPEGRSSPPEQGYGEVERKPDHRKTAGPTEADNSGVPPEEQDKSGKGPRL